MKELRGGQHFEESIIVKMQGLRVYINPVAAENHSGVGVFYSRREGGPYYRWQYKDGLGQWCCSRLRPEDFALHALCLARWKAVPVELQTSLIQHYME
jgi:hypothetical protein